MVGTKQVLPGRNLDPQSVLPLIEQERVTVAAGVPTIWLAILSFLEENPGAFDLSSLRAVLIGGSAMPRSVIQTFEENHGIHIIHAWGMTELSPLGTVSNLRREVADEPSAVKYDTYAKQGFPVPFVEIRARNDEGAVPWDGSAIGELEVRGPWVAASYFDHVEAEDRWSADGWFRTGDVVAIDELGYIEIQDRVKDLVKSGGEWISSVALETALMDHPAVFEAAVIAVAHPRWQERPLAVIVCKEGATVTGGELRAFLESRFAKWWLPDAFEVVSSIPKTSVGKFNKRDLRQQFADRFAAPPTPSVN